MAAGDAATSESTKMMAAPITYTYDGESSDLTAPAASWFFAPGAVPSTEQIAALAAALGVQGDVQSLTADQGGGWMVGPSDYSQPTVNVAADALQSWWFSAGNSAAVSAPACELYPPGDPAATQSSDRATSEIAVPKCEEPQPPANVPDQATAEAKARETQADLVIVVGGRMGEMPSQGYTLFDIPTPQMKFVHVMPGAEELGRVYRPTLAIQASPITFAAALADLKPPKDIPWRKDTEAAHADYLAYTEKATEVPGAVKTAAN